MARAPSTKKKTTTSGLKPDRELRKRAAVEYNVVKLSEESVKRPPPPKKAPKEKKKGGAKTKGAKVPYLILIKRALKNVEAPGWGVESIVKYLDANYPGKTNRKFIRLALSNGVTSKIFVKTKSSFRLSKKTQLKMNRTAKKKKATKKSTKKSTTKKATTKKSSSKKSSTKKSTTKKSTGKSSKSKKPTTKKSTTKKAKPATKKSKPTKTKAETSTRKTKATTTPSSPKPKKAKTVIAPPATDEVPVGEARGVWQFYDAGWHNYYPEASAIVEGVYQEFKMAEEGSGLHIRPIQSGHFSYQVNFQTLEQTNTSTGTMRKIRRV